MEFFNKQFLQLMAESPVGFAAGMNVILA